MALWSSYVAAQTLEIVCIEEVYGSATGAPTKTTHRVTVDQTANTLSIEGPLGSLRLPATVATDPSMPKGMAVQASGLATLPMPAKDDVDACLAAAQKRMPEAFEPDGTNAFLAQGCRASAKMTPPVPVIVSVEMVMLERPGIDSFLRHSALCGRRHESGRDLRHVLLPDVEMRVHGREVRFR